MPSHRITDGPLSDTRVAASFVDLCGVETLERLPGHWVFFERDFTELWRCGWGEIHSFLNQKLLTARLCLTGFVFTHFS
jgi:hypothetical protein